MAVKGRGVGTSAKKGSAVSPAWQEAPTEITRRVVLMEIYGDTNTGKTTLALTAPGPIGIIHAAEKLEGIIQPFAQEKTIRESNFGGSYRGTVEKIAKKAKAAFAQMEAAWDDAIDDWARTAILDTHTESWELMRLSYFGMLNPKKGRIDANYGPVNAHWRSLFKTARNQDRCNVIIIGQTKDEYKKGGKSGTADRTGETIRAGQREIPFMVDVIVRTSREEGEFVATIEKGWYNAYIEGIELRGTEIRFSTIMGLITETDPEEWE